MEQRAIPIFGSMKLAQVEPQDMREYIAGLFQGSLSILPHAKLARVTVDELGPPSRKDVGVGDPEVRDAHGAECPGWW